MVRAYKLKNVTVVVSDRFLARHVEDLGRLTLFEKRFLAESLRLVLRNVEGVTKDMVARTIRKVDPPRSTRLS